MEESRRDLLLGTLEQLEEEKLRTFKDKLSKVELKEGYGRIPLARLTDVDPPALTDLLLSSYGEDYGIEVAAGALRAISQGDLAERLVVPPRAAACATSRNRWWRNLLCCCPSATDE
ncbi:PYD and CARD domain containing, partial [Chelydra serpentina]